MTGRLAPGRDAFDLLAASFPGGSITGAPKIRAMELLERLEPVRRGPYTGHRGLARAGRRDGHEHPHPHVRRRRRAADASTSAAGSPGAASRPRSGTRRSRRRAARWARSARARSRERSRAAARPAGRHVWIDGDARAGRRPATCPRSIAGSSSATASSRRSGPAAAARPSSPSTSRASGARPRASTSPWPTSLERDVDAGIAALLAADGLDGPDGDASIRITVSRGVDRRPRAAAAERADADRS